MTTDTADYLARLDAALRDVPHGIAAEIRAGIVEELDGLAPDAAAARIAQLGDPAEIAREAMDAGSAERPSATAAPIAPAKPAVTSTKGFAIIAALALLCGGFVIPVVGWFGGVALVILSGLWRRWEKVVAILGPLALIAVLGLLAMVFAALGSGQEQQGGPMNPLVPTPLDSWHATFILVFLLVPASGLWLLWRLRGRTVPPAS